MEPHAAASEENQITGVIDRHIGCFNRQDLEAFLACWAPDAELAEMSGKVLASGQDQLRAYYQALFDRAPTLRVDLGGRLVRGNFVVDLELGRDHPTRGSFESMVIYRVTDQLIERAWFAR